MKDKKLKIKNRIIYFLPFFFIIAAWSIFSSPYIFKHQIPYPAKFQVSFFTPWNVYEKFAGPVKNNALSDVVNQLYPWKHFTIEELKQGRIPSWNPFSFSGNPHLSNYQSAVLSPFNLLFFALPFNDAWSLLILLQPLLGGFFMYLFLRKISSSPFGQLIGSISFMFCGFMTVWMAYGTLSMAVAFLPLCLYGIERGFREKRILPFFFLSAGLAVSFFSGHFQISLYVALFAFAYLLFSYFVERNMKIFLWGSFFFFLGMIVSLVQIVPSLELYKLSVRSEMFSNKEGIPFNYLFTVFAPDFFGNPVTRNDWLRFYAEWASFIGIIPLVLAAFSLVKKNKRTLFFLSSALVSLLFALDTPFQNILVLLKIPVFSTSIPSRIIVLFSFSLAVLSAVGFDVLKELIEKKKKRTIILLLGAFALFILLTWAGLLLNVLPKDKSLIAIKNMLLPSLIFIGFGTIVIITAFANKKRLFIPAFLIILLLTTFDSLRFAKKWMPFDPADLIYPEVPVIKALKREVDKSFGRAYGSYGAYIDTYYRIPSVEGYDPLYNKRYGELLQSAKSGKLNSAIRSLAILEKEPKYADRILDLLGVNVILHQKTFTFTPWAYPVWGNPGKYVKIYEDDKFELYKNKGAMPRASLFYSYEVIPDREKLIKRFFNEEFNYKKTLILEKDPELKNTKEGKGKVELIKYMPGRIELKVNSTAPSLLFLSDTYSPAWKVKVNGKEEKIFLADYAFRAVRVPQGGSRVEFYYGGLL